MITDIKERFKYEFEKCVEMVEKRYGKTESGREMVGDIICTCLHCIQHDIETMDFLSFYRKRLSGTLYLDCTDFTKSEIEHIISESQLNDRDKEMARLYWIVMASDETICEKLAIDRKTVHNNIPRISMTLKQTSAKIYK